MYMWNSRNMNKNLISEIETKITYNQIHTLRIYFFDDLFETILYKKIKF